MGIVMNLATKQVMKLKIGAGDDGKQWRQLVLILDLYCILHPVYKSLNIHSRPTPQLWNYYTNPSYSLHTPFFLAFATVYTKLYNSLPPPGLCFFNSGSFNIYHFRISFCFFHLPRF